MQREERDMIYSKRVRAGKRTYFFDVRSTRSNDYYLTVTESRRQQRDGEQFFEKSKMFVYKEDFNKFVEALQDTINHIKTELLPDFDYDQIEAESSYTEPTINKTAEMKEGADEKDPFGNTDLKWE